jgi:hypothetical protein
LNSRLCQKAKYSARERDFSNLRAFQLSYFAGILTYHFEL